MLKFTIEAIRYHRQGVTLEVREVGEPKESGKSEVLAHFRCSAPTQGPNFTLNFHPSDPLYPRAVEARIGTVFELVLQAPPAVAP